MSESKNAKAPRPATKPALMAGTSRQTIGSLLARQALVDRFKAPAAMKGGHA